MRTSKTIKTNLVDYSSLVNASNKYDLIKDLHRLVRDYAELDSITHEQAITNLLLSDSEIHIIPAEQSIKLFVDGRQVYISRSPLYGFSNFS